MRAQNYTRQDATVAIAWMAPRWTAYGEVGATVVQDFPEQEPGFAQLGAQTGGGTRWWRGEVGWYAAIDLQSFEENGWEPGVGTEIGLKVPIPRSDHSIGLACRATAGAPSSANSTALMKAISRSPSAF